MCYWSPVHEVCPNYEVVTFQPRTLENPDLVSNTYFYTYWLLNLPHPLLLMSDVRPGGEKPTPAPPTQPPTPILLIHGIIRPSRRHPSPSQPTKKTSPPPLPPHPSLYRYQLLLSPLNSATPAKLLSPQPSHCRQKNLTIIL